MYKNIGKLSSKYEKIASSLTEGEWGSFAAEYERKLIPAIKSIHESIKLLKSLAHKLSPSGKQAVADRINMLSNMANQLLNAQEDILYGVRVEMSPIEDDKETDYEEV